MISSHMKIFLLIFVYVVSHGYQFPKKEPVALKVDEDVLLLRKLSRGITKVASHAQKALVFISVSKTVKDLSYGTIDPFEFFHNPNIEDPKRKPPQREGLGSGFIVDLDMGYVLTNNHVIAGAQQINLKLANGQVYQGRLIGTDKSTDIAVIQIANRTFKRQGLSQLVFGNSESLQVGDFVLALGAPFGLEASLSFGVISATSRGNLSITKFGDFLQTDAAINPGNSGGPLISMNGKVIGLNTAIYSRSGGYNGISFAVPSSIVREIAERLINKGFVNRGYLGIGLQQIDEELKKSLGIPTDVVGVLVAKVAKKSPAERYGVKSGDVIISIDGRPTDNTAAAKNIIGIKKPGSRIKIVFFRDSKKFKTTVVVGKWPKQEVDLAKQETPKKNSNALGLVTSKNTEFLREKYSIENTEGVVVTHAESDSPAYQAGIRKGDLIMQINGQKVDSVSSVNKAASSSEKQLIRIERKGKYFFVLIER